MWLLTKSRDENDLRSMLNLDHCSRINITPLGERWFVEATLDTEAIPLAATTSLEEADAVLDRLLKSLQAGEKALDLDAAPESPPTK